MLADLPRADVKGKPTTAYVKSVGDSYGYSVQEMRASRLAGKSLDVRKAEAARYAERERMLDREFSRILLKQKSHVLTLCGIRVGFFRVAERPTRAVRTTEKVVRPKTPKLPRIPIRTKKPKPARSKRYGTT